LKKDVCPDGDFSPSYYDKQCDDLSHPSPTTNTSGRDGSLTHPNVDAFDDMDTINLSDTDTLPMHSHDTIQTSRTPITRAEMAKLIVAFSQLMDAPRHSDAFRSQ
jgi:hypothetical protein